MPIGISFYTLQAIGYMTDVYWGAIRAEAEIWRTALFLGFFPQIMEEPQSQDIQMWQILCIQESHWNMRNVVDGYVRIFWGLFKKMVIADRMALMVNQVFDHYADYHGAVILAAAIGYVIPALYGILRLYGYHYRKWKAVWYLRFRKTSDSRSVRRIAGILAQMAYYTRRGSRHIFSIRYRYPDWLKMEPLWKKALRKAYYKTGDFCNRPVPSVGYGQGLAWRTVELYFLWNVLFCIDHAWDCCGVRFETIF